MITCVIAYREYEEIAIAANNLCFWGAVIIYLVEFKKYIKEQRQLGSRFYNNGGKTIITFMVVLSYGNLFDGFTHSTTCK